MRHSMISRAAPKFPEKPVSFAMHVITRSFYWTEVASDYVIVDVLSSDGSTLFVLADDVLAQGGISNTPVQTGCLEVCHEYLDDSILWPQFPDGSGPASDSGVHMSGDGGRGSGCPIE